jgi:hypothetical protein
MAERNHPVPPVGPKMEPMTAPNLEMPTIEDAMFQNFDFSLFAPSGSSRVGPSSRTHSRTNPADASGLVLVSLVMMMMERKTTRIPELMMMSSTDQEH